MLDANSFKRTRKVFDASQIKQEAPDEQQQRKRDEKLISKKQLVSGLGGLSLMKEQELQISKDEYASQIKAAMELLDPSTKEYAQLQRELKELGPVEKPRPCGDDTVMDLMNKFEGRGGNPSVQYVISPSNQSVIATNSIQADSNQTVIATNPIQADSVQPVELPPGQEELGTVDDRLFTEKEDPVSSEESE